MDCDRELDDSDSDSLPDLSAYLKPTLRPIAQGDIVWAKYKQLYWPALVRRIYPKEKKISIWYCDQPNETFKLPSKNVYHYNDSEMYKKILNDVKEAGVLHEHDGLRVHANCYLTRKLQGHKDDPAKFFDQTYPFFLAEEMLKKDPNADVSGLKIPPMYISQKKKQTLSKRKATPTDESGDSEIEKIDGESSPTKKEDFDYVSKINAQLPESTSYSNKEIDINKIVKCIISGEAVNYLKNIKSKRIASEYHDLYEQSVKNNKFVANAVTFTGPIDDDSSLRQIIFYLLPFNAEMNNACKPKHFRAKKRKTALDKTSSFTNRREAEYVASVLLPEAIIFAISKVKKVCLDEAKVLFNKKSECETKAIQNILMSLDTPFRNEIACTSAYVKDNEAGSSKDT